MPSSALQGFDRRVSVQGCVGLEPHSKEDEHRRIIESGGKTTGSCLWSVLHYLDQEASHGEDVTQLVILENVVGLLQGSNMETIAAEFRRRGFSFKAFVICPYFLGCASIVAVCG